MKIEELLQEIKKTSEPTKDNNMALVHGCYLAVQSYLQQKPRGDHIHYAQYLRFKIRLRDIQTGVNTVSDPFATELKHAMFYVIGKVSAKNSTTLLPLLLTVYHAVTQDERTAERYIQVYNAHRAPDPVTSNAPHMNLVVDREQELPLFPDIQTPEENEQLCTDPGAELAVFENSGTVMAAFKLRLLQAMMLEEAQEARKARGRREADEQSLPTSESDAIRIKVIDIALMHICTEYSDNPSMGFTKSNHGLLPAIDVIRMMKDLEQIQGYLIAVQKVLQNNNSDHFLPMLEPIVAYAHGSQLADIMSALGAEIETATATEVQEHEPGDVDADAQNRIRLVQSKDPYAYGRLAMIVTMKNYTDKRPLERLQTVFGVFYNYARVLTERDMGSFDNYQRYTEQLAILRTFIHEERDVTKINFWLKLVYDLNNKSHTHVRLKRQLQDMLTYVWGIVNDKDLTADDLEQLLLAAQPTESEQRTCYGQSSFVASYAPLYARNSSSTFPLDSQLVDMTSTTASKTRTTNERTAMSFNDIDEMSLRSYSDRVNVAMGLEPQVQAGLGRINTGMKTYNGAEVYGLDHESFTGDFEGEKLSFINMANALHAAQLMFHEYQLLKPNGHIVQVELMNLKLHALSEEFKKSSSLDDKEAIRQQVLTTIADAWSYLSSKNGKKSLVLLLPCVTHAFGLGDLSDASSAVKRASLAVSHHASGGEFKAFLNSAGKVDLWIERLRVLGMATPYNQAIERAASTSTQPEDNLGSIDSDGTVTRNEDSTDIAEVEMYTDMLNKIIVIVTDERNELDFTDRERSYARLLLTGLQLQRFLANPQVRLIELEKLVRGVIVKLNSINNQGLFEPMLAFVLNIKAKSTAGELPDFFEYLSRVKINIAEQIDAAKTNAMIAASTKGFRHGAVRCQKAAPYINFKRDDTTNKITEPGVMLVDEIQRDIRYKAPLWMRQLKAIPRGVSLDTSEQRLACMNQQLQRVFEIIRDNAKLFDNDASAHAAKVMGDVFIQHNSASLSVEERFEQLTSVLLAAYHYLRENADGINYLLPLVTMLVIDHFEVNAADVKRVDEELTSEDELPLFWVYLDKVRAAFSGRNYKGLGLDKAPGIDNGSLAHDYYGQMDALGQPTEALDDEGGMSLVAM